MRKKNNTKVTVVAFGDRTHYQLQWTDPKTGKKRTESSGIENDGKAKSRAAAERLAGDKEKQLRAQREDLEDVTWEKFRDRYETEVLTSLADKTDRIANSVCNLVERIIKPRKLSDVTEEALSTFASTLREKGRAEATIKSHLGHLKAALRWAERQKLLDKAPHIDMPKRAKGSKMMKGRPITLEEFERILDKVPVVLYPALKEDPNAETDAETIESWRHYLRGLWASGLRLTESLELYWDRSDKLCIDLAGRRPMLRIPAELEKGNQDRILPVAPEFAEFLLATPKADRHGPVFKPRSHRANRTTTGYIGPNKAGQRIVAMGKAAGVKVSTTGKVKFASAHDLRRSFGERWASRVMPQILMELMRHESIDTTMRYYVGRNAERTANVLWEAHEKATGNTFANSGSPVEGETINISRKN